MCLSSYPQTIASSIPPNIPLTNIIALRQHYNKIKRETKGGGAGSGEISAQATPSRRRTGGIAQPRKRKPANMEDDDDNAFPSVNSTPTKFAASSTNGTPSKDTKVKKLKEEDDIPAAPVFKVDEEGQEAVNLVSDDEWVSLFLQSSNQLGSKLMCGLTGSTTDRRDQRQKRAGPSGDVVENGGGLSFRGVSGLA